MRIAVVLFLSAGMLAGQAARPDSAQNAAIEGVVVDQATGQPLGGVRIHFLGGDFSEPGGGIGGAYGAVSDAAGHYSVTGMKPGLYIVMMERAGFVPAPAHTSGAIPFTTIPLKPGQQLTNHKLAMTPRATIAGRVVDEYGDPVQNVSIQVESDDAGNLSANMFGGTNARTDDRGEFRLVAGPGKYYLQAHAFNNGGTVEIRSDGTAVPAYVPTYYPGSASKNAAAVIEAAAGQDIAGLEIRLARGGVGGPAARPLNISGVVSGIPEGQHATIMLHSEESGGFDSRSTTTQDGKFSINGLAPGLYRVFAWGSGKIPLQSAITEVRLAGTDEANVQLVLGPPPELSGTVEFSGEPPAEKRTVRLEAMGGYPWGLEMSGGEVDQKGAFRIAGVPPGKFRVQVEPLPDNAYMKSVVLDGGAVEDGVLDFSHGVKGNRLKISVSLNGGQVSGRVLDKDGEPVTGPMIMVFLATDVKQIQKEENTSRAVDGKYSFKAIRPGKYHIAALDVLQQASLFDGGNEDEFMKSFFAAGEEIEIKEGARIEKDLKVIDKIPGKEAPNGK
jgi:protocatechuate 3,4-dioxygenase beta subunit